MFSLPSRALGPLSPLSVLGGGAAPTPSYTSNMVIAWEFFRGEDVIEWKNSSVSGTQVNSWVSLIDAPQDGNINGGGFGTQTNLGGTTPNSYYQTSGGQPFFWTFQGAAWPAGTQVFTGDFDRYNLADFYGSGTSITSGDPKTFCQIIEVDSFPNPGDISFIAGSLLGSNGWRLYIDETGALIYQYRQYVSYAGTILKTLPIATLTVGTKYLLAASVTPSGTNKVWLSTGSSNNSSTPYSISVSRYGWSSFPPNNVYWANIASNNNYDFRGKFYGVWAWDTELTDTQMNTLYLDLKAASAI